jgi:hypothetical protein
MAFCPADCQDLTITPNPTQCELTTRNDAIARFGFYTCDVTLPSPLTQAGLEGLVTAGKLAFTSPLANVTANAPEFADVVITDCIPALRIVSTRVFDWQDRVAIDIASSLTPLTEAQPYAERLFWNDKVGKQLSLRTLIIMCSGAVFVAKDSNGNPLAQSVTAYWQQENIGTATSPRFINYIVGQTTWTEDPMGLAIMPEMDDNVVININNFGLF